MRISIKIIPLFIRQTIYFAIAQELQQITATDVQTFAAKVLAAVKRALAL